MFHHASYFICKVQGCDSNVVCEALGRTSVAGRPTKYFVPAFPGAAEFGHEFARFEESDWARRARRLHVAFRRVTTACEETVRSTLVFLLSSAASTIVAFLLLSFLFMRYWGLVSVEGVPHDTFPVLVWQSDPTCDVVAWGELKAAGMQTTDWSYIPPTADLEECRSRLRPDARFEIRPADTGRHHIELTSSPGGDEVNASRYWATAEAIEPISHQRYFGPLVAIAAAGAAAGVGLVAGIFAVLRSRRRRASA